MVCSHCVSWNVRRVAYLSEAHLADRIIVVSSALYALRVILQRPFLAFATSVELVIRFGAVLIAFVVLDNVIVVEFDVYRVGCCRVGSCSPRVLGEFHATNGDDGRKNKVSWQARSSPRCPQKKRVN